MLIGVKFGESSGLFPSLGLPSVTGGFVVVVTVALVALLVAAAVVVVVVGAELESEISNETAEVEFADVGVVVSFPRWFMTITGGLGDWIMGTLKLFREGFNGILKGVGAVELLLTVPFRCFK